MRKWLVSLLGGIVMTVSVVSLIIAILVVFKVDSAREPAIANYLIATSYGAFFGFTIASGGFWMTTGRLRSKTQTLLLATVIVVVICGTVFLWVYALIVAGLNDLGHPVWASLLLGAMVIGLVVWAVRHQLRWGRRAQVAADAHPLATMLDLRAGAAFKLRGRVEFDQELHTALRGPVSGRSCAMFNLDIIEGDITEAIIAGQLEMSREFELRCVDGSVHVDARSFIAGYTRDAQRHGRLDISDARILEALDRAPRGPLSGRELSIGSGDIVDVVGIAEQVDAHWVLKPFDKSALIVVQKDPTDPTLGALPAATAATLATSPSDTPSDIPSDVPKTRVLREQLESRRPPADLASLDEEAVHDLLAEVVHRHSDMHGTTRISIELLGVEINRTEWPTVEPVIAEFVHEWEDKLVATHGLNGLCFVAELGFRRARGKRRTGRSQGRFATVHDAAALAESVERLEHTLTELRVPRTRPLTTEHAAALGKLFSARFGMHRAATPAGAYDEETIWGERIYPGEHATVRERLETPVLALIDAWREALEADHNRIGLLFFAEMSRDRGGGILMDWDAERHGPTRLTLPDP